jgi:putative SOS response-associated peptidase YedK
MVSERERLRADLAIITTASKLVVALIHDRMPAILEGDSLVLWLNPATPTNDLLGLLGPTRDDLLGCRAVSPAVNHAKNDGPELLA